MKDPNILAPVAVMPTKNNNVLMCAPVTEVRRVPCKARGVRGDHNLRTAYFDIPVNAEHGLMLVCSHEGCAASGRRFRYCAICDLPVAKRNFSKRHGHGLIKPTRGGAANSISSVSVATENTLAGTKHRRSVSNDEYFPQENVPPAQATVSPTLSPTLSQPFASTASVSSASAFQTVQSTTGAAIEEQDPNTGMMTIQLNPIEFQWLALFHNRPSMEDSEAMNRWMDNVIQLSEPSNVPSVTPPSWNTDGDATSSEGSTEASAMEPLAAVETSNKESDEELQPNTAEASRAIAAAEINSGLALAEAASTAAAALPGDEIELPPLKLQRSEGRASSVTSDWTDSDIDKVLAL
eukprot:CAMPEP_0202495796 /NCGR_PEP_ID=MMETSP1361-20130828/17786_1 /ASSEMBLY_ACC=CAM_ASM_000849 /TAXON_ID=210615 /ORGANISM="Staurosira complex sp., Strain CCMP2646" /LENGTH=350 /DNA_ID=CAMNT_0049126931 /DNA_START=37 /DNA_END=1089 /DNA_ORIENTATION=+